MGIGRRPGSTWTSSSSCARRRAIAEHLRDVADEMLEAREAEVGPEAWATIERFVLLRTIDSLWVEHLTEVDDMRRGIGLRGYAQQDPLNEFRKEAFRLYEELSGLHPAPGREHDLPGLRSRPQPQPPGRRLRRCPARASRLAAPCRWCGAPGQQRRGGGRGRRRQRAPQRIARPVAHDGRTRRDRHGRARVPRRARASRPGPATRPQGAKIGRNDACWCGSGLKYKKCHGR